MNKKVRGFHAWKERITSKVRPRSKKRPKRVEPTGIQRDVS